MYAMILRNVGMSEYVPICCTYVCAAGLHMHVRVFVRMSVCTYPFERYKYLRVGMNICTYVKCYVIVQLHYYIYRVSC
jgi:hypothetical protein